MLKLCFSQDGNGLEDKPFFANIENVKAAAHTLRSLLNELSDGCIRQPPAVVEKRFGTALPELQAAGRELFEHLFAYDPDGTPMPTGDRRKRIEYFWNKNLVDRELLIKCDGEIRIPWGFLFSGMKPPQRRAPELGASFPETEAFSLVATRSAQWEGFWLDRFNVSVRLNEASPFEDDPQTDFKPLFALHEKIFYDAKERLCAELRDKLTDLLRKPSHVVHNFEQWRDYWREIANHDSLLYFFGHSDGQRIYLKDGAASTDRRYCLDTSSIITEFRLKKENSQSATICFFNGCNTATGAGHVSFLLATHRPGFHGFIGTEAQIPSDIANEYATEFLSGLRTGKYSVGQVFEQLKFAAGVYPWSLFYSCNANRSMRTHGWSREIQAVAETPAVQGAAEGTDA
jgi:hypothetical protein